MRLWKIKRQLTRGLRRLQRWNRRARKLLRQLPMVQDNLMWEQAIQMPSELMGKTPLMLKVGTALQIRMLLEDWILLLERVQEKVEKALEVLSTSR